METFKINNNPFARDKNSIFYTKIGTDVYQVKFEHIIYSIGNYAFKSRSEPIDFCKNLISSTVINVAGIGENCYDSYYGSIYGNQPIANLGKIYNSVEDCIDEYDPVFKHLSTPGGSYTLNFEYDLVSTPEDITPYYAFLEEIQDSKRYRYMTYFWDGTKVQKECCSTPSKSFKKIVSEDIEGFYFDLVDECWLVDDKYCKTHYSTYEECNNSNTVKVHTF